jgi:hypothetical protein
MRQANIQLAVPIMALVAACIGASVHAAPPENGVYRVNILDYGTKDDPVDRSGVADDSAALAKAMDAANAYTSVRKPACVMRLHTGRNLSNRICASALCIGRMRERGWLVPNDAAH